MIINLNLTLDYNPETGECSVVKTERAKSSTKVAVDNDTAEPQIVLDANKYILNQAAANLMGVKWEDRLEIKYQKVQGVIYPVIGTGETFGTKTGNKLTKTLTVSCRGKANEMLARYGRTFTVSEMKGEPGLFVLIGDNPPAEEEVVEEIEIKEDENDFVDLPLDVDIENAEKIDELDFTLD